MKFSQMKYKRPDIETVKNQLTEAIKALKAAKSYEEAKKVFLQVEEESKHVSTARTLATIRNSINTKDKFYDEEEKFWNKASPELQEYGQAWTTAMLKSPFVPILRPSTAASCL